jgi:hypothetical protein
VIHRLRRRHRRLWIAIAILLPALYLIALASRQPQPVVESLPVPLSAAGGPHGEAAP